MAGTPGADAGGLSDSEYEDEEGDEVRSLQSFSDDDAKTRFTNYSMSSSVIRRNEGLTLIDDKFERVCITTHLFAWKQGKNL